MTAAGVDDESGLTAARAWIASREDFFDLRRPVLMARAPGRLDVMGGIADYSGSLVLQLPLAIATWVAVQEQSAPELVVESIDKGVPGADARVTLPIAEITPTAGLGGDPRRDWVAHIAGALVVLQREYGRRLSGGARVLVRSNVPIGKGVSSSAALGVAAFEGLAGLAAGDIYLADRELALAAQKVENQVVGAPSGVMDQMTAAIGQRDHLLELICRPAEIVGHRPIPPGLELYGIDSGIRHAVSGSDYRSVRAAAFMGYQMVAAATGLAPRVVGPGRVVIDDPHFGGYLANVSSSVWRGRYRDAIPERMTGGEFLARFGGSTDTATTIDEARSYPVRAATEHPILEHERVRQFGRRLADGGPSEAIRVELGELMYESHASYSACRLGSDGTDRLVELARASGPGAGVYGAKITGGGSGGTVAVLARAGRRAAIDEIAGRYREETGRDATVFFGSSPGARPFGVRSFTRL